MHDAGAKFATEIVTEMSPFLYVLLTWILPIVVIIGVGQYLSKKLMDRAGGQNSMMFGMGKSDAKIYVKSSEGAVLLHVRLGIRGDVRGYGRV